MIICLRDEDVLVFYRINKKLFPSFKNKSSFHIHNFFCEFLEISGSFLYNFPLDYLDSNLSNFSDIPSDKFSNL